MYWMRLQNAVISCGDKEGKGMVTMTAGQFALCMIGAAVMGAVTLAVLAAMTVSGRGDT